MSKKTVKKTTKPLSPRPAVKQDDTAHVVREDLDEESEGLSSSTRPPAGTSQPPAASVKTEDLPNPATAPLRPLAPLGALWPDSGPTQSASGSLPAPEPRPAPASASAPQASSALASRSPNPAVQSVPPKVTQDVKGVTPADKPASLPGVQITFVLLEPAAKQVSLCGEFNGWSHSANPMKRQADGHWETTISLAPGRHEYKFIVDGEWIPDPLAHENVWNPRGTLNSVIEVSA